MMCSTQRPPSVRLASVKHQLYHPQLPTLRRMSMDTVLHKLTTEHSRHITSCEPENFLSARSTLVTKAPAIPCRRILDRTTESTMRTIGTRNTDAWRKLLGTVQTNNSGDLYFSGLAIRDKHPSITSSWQTTISNLTGPHRPKSSKPMPATLYSRYRVSSRPGTATPWRQ
ncbi:hypothetical protein EMCRGX_G031775 [Ephydatia muelleri]